MGICGKGSAARVTVVFDIAFLFVTKLGLSIHVEGSASISPDVMLVIVTANYCCHASAPASAMLRIEAEYPGIGYHLDERYSSRLAVTS
jgi:hypothetical protein